MIKLDKTELGGKQHFFFENWKEICISRLVDMANIECPQSYKDYFVQLAINANTDVKVRYEDNESIIEYQKDILSHMSTLKREAFEYMSFINISSAFEALAKDHILDIHRLCTDEVLDKPDKLEE
jgi:hypothetical protein